MDEGETRALPDTSPPLGVALAIDPDEQLATRAAWLYFVAGLTQAQIGKKLGLNRTRVNRLLAQARDQGLVQINITGRLASCVELEERLRNQYGLEDAVVVPTPPDQALIPQVIATAAAAAHDLEDFGSHDFADQFDGDFRDRIDHASERLEPEQ